jgi:hypothetical protein
VFPFAFVTHGLALSWGERLSVSVVGPSPYSASFSECWSGMMFQAKSWTLESALTW